MIQAVITNTNNELVGNGLSLNLDETEDEVKAEEKESNNILDNKAGVTEGLKREGVELETKLENILS